MKISHEVLWNCLRISECIHSLFCEMNSQGQYGSLWARQSPNRKLGFCSGSWFLLSGSSWTSVFLFIKWKIDLLVTLNWNIYFTKGNVDGHVTMTFSRFHFAQQLRMSSTALFTLRSLLYHQLTPQRKPLSTVSVFSSLGGYHPNFNNMLMLHFLMINSRHYLFTFPNLLRNH